MIQYTVTAETLHEIGREGVNRIRRWLDATARFDISHSAYDFDMDGRPLTQVRVEQLNGGFESFDLIGNMRDARGQRGRTVYVECKNYSQAGDQGTLYLEYLAVAYSAFARQSKALQHPPSVEFMWVTTHPFAVTTFTKLTTAECVSEACAKHASRLGDDDYQDELGAVLADRLWLVIVNDRMLEEMLMGAELRGAVMQKMVEMGTA